MIASVFVNNTSERRHRRTTTMNNDDERRRLRFVVDDRLNDGDALNDDGLNGDKR